MLHFEIFKTKKNEWRWRLVAKNGRIVANSGESYKRRIACERGINVVILTGWKTEIREVAR